MISSNLYCEREVARIANEIVDLVERTGGPVFLHEIEEQVRGFRASYPNAWGHFVGHHRNEACIWDDMTEAGYKALRRVLNERKVASQGVSKRAYRSKGCVRVPGPNWLPIVLLPCARPR
jgi:hypothetical protein